mmetsp:Transcript_41588/g.93811  ORF Transcript_41588/g.93811 Transcript_41588/m.93811 type:complete len:379 (+) Transcript_41588:467-1603(+)
MCPLRASNSCALLPKRSLDEALPTSPKHDRSGSHARPSQVSTHSAPSSDDDSPPTTPSEQLSARALASASCPSSCATRARAAASASAGTSASDGAAPRRRFLSFLSPCLPAAPPPAKGWARASKARSLAISRRTSSSASACASLPAFSPPPEARSTLRSSGSSASAVGRGNPRLTAAFRLARRSASSSARTLASRWATSYASSTSAAVPWVPPLVDLSSFSPATSGTSISYVNCGSGNPASAAASDSLWCRARAASWRADSAPSPGAALTPSPSRKGVAPPGLPAIGVSPPAPAAKGVAPPAPVPTSALGVGATDALGVTPPKPVPSSSSGFWPPRSGVWVWSMSSWFRASWDTTSPPGPAARGVRCGVGRLARRWLA